MLQGRKNWGSCPLPITATVWSSRYFRGMWLRGRRATLVQIQLLPALSDGDLLGLPGAPPHGDRVRSFRGGQAETFSKKGFTRQWISLRELSPLTSPLYTHWQFPLPTSFFRILCSSPWVTILGFTGLAWFDNFFNLSNFSAEPKCCLEVIKETLSIISTTHKEQTSLCQCA